MVQPAAATLAPSFTLLCLPSSFSFSLILFPLTFLSPCLSALTSPALPSWFTIFWEGSLSPPAEMDGCPPVSQPHACLLQWRVSARISPAHRFSRHSRTKLFSLDFEEVLHLGFTSKQGYMGVDRTKGISVSLHTLEFPFIDQKNIYIPAQGRDFPGMSLII